MAIILLIGVGLLLCLEDHPEETILMLEGVIDFCLDFL